MTNHPDQTVKDLAHLAFCALVALHTAIGQGAVASPMAEHLFLVRWLATAQKQKRFPRSVAVDIQQLLDKGRKQGMEAKLRNRFEYIWQSCNGELRNQSDLFRLTYAIESLKAQGWRNELVSEAQWDKGLSDERGPALFAIKSALNSSFTQDGRLVTPLELHITGDMQCVIDVLASCYLDYQHTDQRITLLSQT